MIQTQANIQEWQVLMTDINQAKKLDYRVKQITVDNYNQKHQNY